jgi:hypothetical protein
MKPPLAHPSVAHPEAPSGTEGPFRARPTLLQRAARSCGDQQPRNDIIGDEPIVPTVHQLDRDDAHAMIRLAIARRARCDGARSHLDGVWREVRVGDVVRVADTQYVAHAMEGLKRGLVGDVQRLAQPIGGDSLGRENGRLQPLV